MEAPQDIDIRFLRSALLGDLATLQKIVKVFENSEGPGKISYEKLKTPHGHNALHEAASAGKSAICRFLVEKLKFDVNAAADFTKETPLLLSIRRAHPLTAILLIASGADVTKGNMIGETALHNAATGGCKEFVKLILSKGGDLNAISGAGMPLHSAVRYGHLDVTKYLLKRKADVNPAITSYDMSPLCLSLSSGSIECIKQLLKAGADPNRPCYLRTPLHFAVSIRDEEVIRCLLNAGADPNMPDPDFVAHTPLEYAAFHGYLEEVKLLFPVTSPIPCFPCWSVRGVMEYAKSEEAITLFKSKRKETVLLLKAKGKEAFQRKNYIDAVEWYTMAEDKDIADVKLLSNRSLCFSKMCYGRDALADAQKCVELEPSWVKAHYREGAAWNVLRNFTKAAEAFSRALAIEPNSKEIERAYMAALSERNKFIHWDEDED